MPTQPVLLKIGTIDLDDLDSDGFRCFPKNGLLKCTDRHAKACCIPSFHQLECQLLGAEKCR